MADGGTGNDGTNGPVLLAHGGSAAAAQAPGSAEPEQTSRRGSSGLGASLLWSRPKAGFSSARLFGPFIRLGLIALAILIVISFGRSFLDSLLIRLDQSKMVHSDRSEAHLDLARAVPNQITLSYASANGHIQRVLVDRGEYSDFMKSLFARLEADRVRIVASIPERLKLSATPVFDDIRGNVDAYADWYYSQWTTYKLLAVGGQAYVQNQLSPTAVPAEDMAAAALSKYIHERFRDTVLKPEINDYKIHKAFLAVYGELHRDYLRSLALADQDFHDFAARRLPYNQDSKRAEPTLDLDWSSNLNKLSMALHEKGGIGALARGALSLSIGSKLVAPALALSIAGKKAVLGVIAKLSAPFMTKIMAAVGGSAAAGAVGLATGPLAPVVAPAMAVGFSLGADYLISEVDEHNNRETFVTDVRGSVSAIEEEWLDLMKEPMTQAIDIWYDDTLNLLSDFKK
ncbi:MAG: hypothetical protein GC191_18650 [Azospirillum sp.]|nr:hypothetical protein [Azospirillum sp.]